LESVALQHFPKISWSSFEGNKMISFHDLQTYIAGVKQRQRQKQILLNDRYELLQTVSQ
jgi:hypothetical protein